MATKLEGALVAGQIKKNFFCGFPKVCVLAESCYEAQLYLVNFLGVAYLYRLES